MEVSTTDDINCEPFLFLFFSFRCFSLGLFDFLDGVLDPCKRFNPSKSYSFSNLLSPLLPKFTAQSRRGDSI